MADKSIIVQKMPFVQTCKAGKYAWCACGHSENQPFCDGSHKDTEFKPIIVNQEDEKKIAWCGCKQSGNKPYCDGSHVRL